MKKIVLFLLLACAAIASAPQERFVPSRNGTLFCRTFGQGDPIIVLHGGPGLSQEYLLPQMEQLAENNLVIFYDQWGCGASQGEISAATVSTTSFLEDLESIQKAFGLTKVTLAGHSWGGLLAIQYAIAHPEAVEKMILFNSLGASSEEFFLFLQEWLRRMAPYQAKFDAIQSSPKLAAGDPDTVENFYWLMFRTYCHNPRKVELLNLKMSPAAGANGLKVNGLFFESFFSAPFDFHPALQKLQIPTLILHGDSDVVPLLCAENLHKSIKGSRYVLLSDCGHFPYVETPKPFFDEIKAFLSAP